MSRWGGTLVPPTFAATEADPRAGPRPLGLQVAAETRRPTSAPSSIPTPNT